jgi:hypothetical protein
MSDVEKAPHTDTVIPSNHDSIEGDTLSLHEHQIEHIDIGLQLYQKALEFDPEQLARDAVHVRRKLDWLVLPMLCGTYLISFLDKQT